MKTTANYGLNKPDGTDVVDISVLNANMDKIDTEMKKVNEQLGDMTQVPTTNKNVSGAIKELFTNVDNGKNAISGAITDVDSNVVIPTNPSFGDLTNAIGQINTGRKWASGITGYTNGENVITINGLNFTPKTVLVQATYFKTAYASDIGLTMTCWVTGSNAVANPSSKKSIEIITNGFNINPLSNFSGEKLKWVAYE